MVPNAAIQQAETDTEGEPEYTAKMLDTGIAHDLCLYFSEDRGPTSNANRLLFTLDRGRISHFQRDLGAAEFPSQFVDVDNRITHRSLGTTVDRVSRNF
jgi:hypothetical protein